MTNTDRLYTAIRDFTNTRRANRDAYLAKKKRLESYKGSDGYKKELDEEMKKRNKADAEAGEICKKIIRETVADMRTANGKRGVVPPSDEHIRLLTVAQMIKKPSISTLESIAVSLGGNAVALSALTDIAREAWKDDPEHAPTRLSIGFNRFATESYEAQEAESMIDTLEKACFQIIDGHGVPRSLEIAAKHNANITGVKVDWDELKQDEPYTVESEFYERTMSGRVDGFNHSLFAKAVN